MDENSYNLSNLFKSPFGPNNPRNRIPFGPSRKNLVPFTPTTFGKNPFYDFYQYESKKYDYPFAEQGIREYYEEELKKYSENFLPNIPTEDELTMKKQKTKEKEKVKETMCECGRAMQPITVEVSFKLKNPEVTYVGDIFIEYCPACQDEQFLALACKNASYKFLTNLSQKKK